MRHFYSSFFSPAEARRLIRLGVPVFVAQMANTGMTFIDTAMTGQASAEDMAAVALAGSLWFPVSTFGLGVLLAISPLMAQLVGAQKAQQTPHLLRQGIWCALLLMLPLMGLLFFLSYNLEHFGLEAHLATLAGGYLRAITCGLPGLMLFVCVRSLLEGFSRTRPAMMVSMLGLSVNIPCNYIFIYGKCGLPALGAVGCGIATCICFWFMFGCMLVYVYRDTAMQSLAPIFAPMWRGGQQQRVDWPCVRRIMRIGFPGALALLFEVSLFAMTALLLAPLGTTVVAGHQVALNFSSLLFVVPMSIGITATIRVGHCLGAQQWTHARLTAWTALSLGMTLAVVNALMTAVFREYIVHIYNNDAAVLVVAMPLLLYAAAFQVLDAIQAVGAGVLRGYNDTRIISIVCFVAYWFVSLPLGYVLARTTLFGPPQGAGGFWLAYLVGLVIGGLCYTARLIYLQRRAGAWLQQKINK